MSPYPDQANHDLLERIPLSAGVVLDVGCHTGALGAAYRRLNPRALLLGIESDPARRSWRRGGSTRWPSWTSSRTRCRSTLRPPDRLHRVRRRDRAPARSVAGDQPPGRGVERRWHHADLRAEHGPLELRRPSAARHLEIRAVRPAGRDASALVQPRDDARGPGGGGPGAARCLAAGVRRGQGTGVRRDDRAGADQARRRSVGLRAARRAAAIYLARDETAAADDLDRGKHAAAGGRRVACACRLPAAGNADRPDRAGSFRHRRRDQDARRRHAAHLRAAPAGAVGRAGCRGDPRPAVRRLGDRDRVRRSSRPFRHARCRGPARVPRRACGADQHAGARPRSCARAIPRSWCSPT